MKTCTHGLVIGDGMVAVSNACALCQLDAAKAEIAHLRDALEEQLILQYGAPPQNLDAVVGKLLQMRKDRFELDNSLGSGEAVARDTGKGVCS